MKPKVFNKTLNLNKKTIAHLNSNDMEKANGGVSGKVCPTYLCPATMVTWCPTNYSLGDLRCCNGCIE